MVPQTVKAGVSDVEKLYRALDRYWQMNGPHVCLVFVRLSVRVVCVLCLRFECVSIHTYSTCIVLYTKP